MLGLILGVSYKDYSIWGVLLGGFPYFGTCPNSSRTPSPPTLSAPRAGKAKGKGKGKGQDLSLCLGGLGGFRGFRGFRGVPGGFGGFGGLAV